MIIFKKAALACAVLTMPLGLGACAENFAAEGAAIGAGAGAIAARATGRPILTGAAVGAAAGAAVGYFVDKDNDCDGYNGNGRLDSDCRGTRGYPN